MALTPQEVYENLRLGGAAAFGMRAWATLTQDEKDAWTASLSAPAVRLAEVAQRDKFAAVASPTLTGDPKAPTATFGDNDTSLATTGFVQNAVAAVAIAAGAQSLDATSVKTGPYTAAPGDLVDVKCTSGSVPITLPTAPADRSRVGVKVTDLTGSNVCTIATGGSDVFNKAGGSTTLTLSLVNQAVSLQYNAETGVWYVVSTDVPLGQLDARYPQKSTNVGDTGKVISAYTGLPVNVDSREASVSLQAPVAGTYANKVIKGGSGYFAFPGVGRMPDNRLICVFRGNATLHQGEAGDLRVSYSSDDGVTWTTPVVLAANAARDFRAPRVSVIGTRVWVTFFASTSISGSRLHSNNFMYSDNNGATWTGPVEPAVDTFTAVARTECPIVALPGGDLLWPIQGQNTGDAGWSVATLRSTDGGATWGNQVTILSNPATFDFQEAWVVALANGNLLAVVRENNNSIAHIARSTNNGVSWTDTGVTLTAKGTPATLQLASGRIVNFNRSTSPDGQPILYYSDDNGATWSGPVILDAQWKADNVSAVLYDESQAIELRPGLIGLAIGLEYGSTSAAVEWKYVFDRSGVAPNGDIALRGPIPTGQRLKIRRVGGGSTTLTGAEDIVEAVSGSATTITLPAAAAVPSKVIWVKRKGTGAVTVAATSIDAMTSINVPSQYDVMGFYSNGVLWSIFQQTRAFTGSKTFDFPSIASGDQTTTTVTVTGAALGDIAMASVGVDQQGLVLTAYVSAADTVTVVLLNLTGGAVDLASTTLRARVTKV